MFFAWGMFFLPASMASLQLRGVILRFHSIQNSINLIGNCLKMMKYPTYGIRIKCCLTIQKLTKLGSRPTQKPYIGTYIDFSFEQLFEHEPKCSRETSQWIKWLLDVSQEDPCKRIWGLRGRKGLIPLLKSWFVRSLIKPHFQPEPNMPEHCQYGNPSACTVRGGIYDVMCRCCCHQRSVSVVRPSKPATIRHGDSTCRDLNGRIHVNN